MKEILKALEKELCNTKKISLNITIPFLISYYHGYMVVIKDEMVIEADILLYRNISTFPEKYQGRLKIIKGDIIAWYQVYLKMGEYYL